MRFRLALTLVVSAAALLAQSGGEDPEVVRARAGIDRLRALVEAGAAPSAQLARAEQALGDAEDAAYLRKTLYGFDLTEDQADAMIAAASRRLDRRKAQFAEAQALVKEGVASQLALGAFLEEMDRSRKEFDLAQSRARLLHQLADQARAEEVLQTTLAEAPSEVLFLGDRYDGNGVFTMSDFRRLEAAFVGHFSKPLPVSAIGETAVHRSMGFDHRDRVDVAVHPDQPEGVWLREYLVRNHIPYFAFRQAIPGKATGAHIHVGPVSSRIVRGG
jgi:hypothetical protein